MISIDNVTHFHIVACVDCQCHRVLIECARQCNICIRSIVKDFSNEDICFILHNVVNCEISIKCVTNIWNKCKPKRMTIAFFGITYCICENAINFFSQYQSVFIKFCAINHTIIKHKLCSLSGSHKNCISRALENLGNSISVCVSNSFHVRENHCFLCASTARICHNCFPLKSINIHILVGLNLPIKGASKCHSSILC